MNVENFVSNNKSMLIAPAGHGKTHSIALCLKYIQDNDLGKQLILTHTHAGIISIKEKLKKLGVSSKYFHVETISSYAQKYVLAFCKQNIPNQEDGNTYYKFINKEAEKLFKYKEIKHVIKSTYNGLFVDEFQDCTIEQHKLVNVLSEIMDTHILGDPLQGIFDFNGKVVDLEDSTQFSNFNENCQELTIPWRWKNSNNEGLGNDLLSMRNDLLVNKAIDLQTYRNIDLILTEDIYAPDNSNYLFKIISSQKSILFIDSISVNINSRIKFLQRFKNSLLLIESIDDREFYNLSKLVDDIQISNIESNIYALLIRLTNKTCVDNWLNSKGVRRKNKDKDKTLIKPLKLSIDNLKKNISYKNILIVINCFFYIADNRHKCYRKDLLLSLLKAIEDADSQKTTVYEAMKNRRNILRRVGRKIDGKCIGTTLLTKGLEFDTVVVLNAHLFKDMKNLYVALTRASKKLVVFSKNNILDFN